MLHRELHFFWNIRLGANDTKIVQAIHDAVDNDGKPKGVVAYSGSGAGFCDLKIASVTEPGLQWAIEWILEEHGVRDYTVNLATGSFRKLVGVEREANKPQKERRNEN